LRSGTLLFCLGSEAVRDEFMALAHPIKSTRQPTGFCLKASQQHLEDAGYRDIFTSVYTITVHRGSPEGGTVARHPDFRTPRPSCKLPLIIAALLHPALVRSHPALFRKQRLENEMTNGAPGRNTRCTARNTSTGRSKYSTDPGVAGRSAKVGSSNLPEW